MTNSVTLDTVLELAQQLSALDKLRLIQQVAPQIEPELVSAKPSPKRSLLGIVADLGTAPSADEIDEARREAWANFPREDI